MNEESGIFGASNGVDKTSEKLQTYSYVLLPSNEDLTKRTRMRLHYAGYHAKKYLLQYFAIKVLSIIMLPLLTLILIIVVPNFKADWLINGLLIAFAVGYILPSLILDKKIAQRQKNIQRAFPDALDMLVICSEAGLSLDAAIQRVTVELRFSQPILAEELGLVVAEIQAGIDRKIAMKSLAERTGVKDVRGLMSTLTQCMMFGTSVTEALRVYAEDLRDRRLQAAEESAAKIGAKMIFPLAVCLMPAFVLIVMAPVFLSLSKVMAN
ncbi:MAG: type II secretion system F family protein [Woeseiaceae bacterium]|nr:type II secretion system F family protein [Woeseiaceae bacterium]